VGASSDAGPTVKSAVGTYCSGITTLNTPAANTGGDGEGDYIEIANLQPSIGTAGTLNTNAKICGSYFNSASAATAQITACSFSVPFKVSVHFDENEAIGTSPIAATDLDHVENNAVIGGSGSGYQGFYLAYWQNSC